MSAITTHVLDTARGCPAAGIRVVLEFDTNDQWKPVGRGTTDANGRLRTLLPEPAVPSPGVYRLVFETAAYFVEHGSASLFPRVVVVFEVSDSAAHYHLPLLLSPYGYTTYRGS